MLRSYGSITIRDAGPEDARQLAAWWNDGSVMAHAGFPRGLGTTEEKILRLLAGDCDETGRHLMILHDGMPIGEMNYRRRDEKACEIGIKICEPDAQNRGLGKICLSLLMDSLFREYGYDQIRLDTNLNNLRAQHVYEQLGFVKVRVNRDSWTDQLGHLQSSVDYECSREQWNSFLK